MTTPAPVEPSTRRALNRWSRRRVHATARAMQELATAERDLLQVRRDTAQFDTEQRATIGPATADVAENERGPKRWPVAKIIGAVVISALVLGGTLIMAAVAIGMQIGFFTARLPESVQTVELP